MKFYFIIRNVLICLLDLELIGVESFEFSSSIKVCMSTSEHSFNALEVDGRGSSSICIIVELSQLGQQFFLFTSVKQMVRIICDYYF